MIFFFFLDSSHPNVWAKIVSKLNVNPEEFLKKEEENVIKDLLKEEDLPEYIAKVNSTHFLFKFMCFAWL